MRIIYLWSQIDGQKLGRNEDTYLKSTQFSIKNSSKLPNNLYKIYNSCLDKRNYSQMNELIYFLNELISLDRLQCNYSRLLVPPGRHLSNFMFIV